MAKSRDRQKDELSLPRVGNDGSRGVRSSPPGRRKVLLIAGAAPLSRGLWPNRSWRLDDARRSQKGRPGRGEARRSARGAARGPSRGRERPAPQDLSPAEAGHGVVKRRSLQAALKNIRGRLGNARGAGARSECVGKQTSVRRIARRAPRRAARQVGRAALAHGKPSRRWCG